MPTFLWDFFALARSPSSTSFATTLTCPSRLVHQCINACLASLTTPYQSMLEFSTGFPHSHALVFYLVYRPAGSPGSSKRLDEGRIAEKAKGQKSMTHCFRGCTPKRSNASVKMAAISMPFPHPVSLRPLAPPLRISRTLLLNYTRPARPASGALAGLSYYGLTLYGSYVHVPVSSVLPISHNYVAPQRSPYNGCAFALRPQSLPLPRLRCAFPFFICYTLLTLLLA